MKKCIFCTLVIEFVRFDSRRFARRLEKCPAGDPGSGRVAGRGHRPEVYTGTVRAIGRGAGLASATFTLRITGHTSEEDAQRYLTILAEQRNPLQAELVQGLQEGEQVILHPRNQIEEGSRIRPR
jgi:hypothetical protein